MVGYRRAHARRTQRVGGLLVVSRTQDFNVPFVHLDVILEHDAVARALFEFLTSRPDRNPSKIRQCEEKSCVPCRRDPNPRGIEHSASDGSHL